MNPSHQQHLLGCEIYSSRSIISRSVTIELIKSTRLPPTHFLHSSSLSFRRCQAEQLILLALPWEKHYPRCWFTVSDATSDNEEKLEDNATKTRMEQEQSEGVALSFSVFLPFGDAREYRNSPPRFQKLARRVVEAVDRAYSISSLFSRSSHSSTRQLPVRPTTGSRVSFFLLALFLRPSLPIRFTSFWFWCRCTREKGKKRRRGMTKRPPAAPLVDSDHDSRAAADHRPAESCEDPCLVSWQRNGQTSPRHRAIYSVDRCTLAINL